GPACARGEPPSPASASATAVPLVVSTHDAGQDASFATSDAANDVPSDAAPAVDPATLPQTHDEPHASGPAWEARVAALWSAIVKDEPELAMSFFFPLAAYEQVKDVASPAR